MREKSVGYHLCEAPKGPVSWQMVPDTYFPLIAYLAVEHVFTTDPNQPWFFPIEETFLQSLRQALQDPNPDGSIPGTCEDMPYDCETTVIKRDNEYFVQFDASLIPGVD